MRCASALRTAPSRSIGSRRRDGRSVGSIDDVHSASSVPLTISRFSASSAFRSVACACTSVLPAGRLLGLRLHDVDRRHACRFRRAPVVLHQLRREIERVLRRFDRLRVANTRSQYALRTCATMLTVVALRLSSAMSCWISVGQDRARASVSILKLRSSGCV